MSREYLPNVFYNQADDKFAGPEDVHSRTIDRPLSIVYNTSHECNLRCPYCFRRGSGLPPQSDEEIMSDMDNLPVGEPLRNVLSGGEPFWRKDIYKVIGFCGNQPWDIVVVSNGTYPIAFDSIPKSVMFEFSVDAPNADIYARMRGGTEDQYQTLIGNVKTAAMRGFRVRPCYLMSRVNTSEEILRRITDFSVGLGVGEIRLQRFKPWGGGKELSEMYEFSQEEYRVICQRAVEYAERVGIKIRVPQNNRFLAVGSVYVLPDGKVTIQDGDRPEQFVLGNLRRQNLKELWGPYKERFSGDHLRWLIRPKRII